MFSKLSIAVTSVLITLAAATPTTRNVVPPVSTPNTLLRCESIVSSASATASAVGAILGLDLTELKVDVGLSCSPITVIGNNCGDTEVTCDAPEKEWGGLIAINCIPIAA
ncbi:fungal hydrophobin [Mycena rebaudengoi]|nr:fungal hydrophobin [Mycena rebaudengoi]